MMIVGRVDYGSVPVGTEPPSPNLTTKQPILKISKISVSKLTKIDVINYISISYTV
jgi:hypothetical protein